MRKIFILTQITDHWGSNPPEIVAAAFDKSRLEARRDKIVYETHNTFASDFEIYEVEIIDSES